MSNIWQAIAAINKPKPHAKGGFQGFKKESVKKSTELEELIQNKMSEEEFLKFREKLESKKKKDSIILLILLGAIVLTLTLVVLFLT